MMLGDYATGNPGADQGTDGDQDKDGPHPLGNAVNGCLFQGFVIVAEFDAKPHDDETRR